MDAADRPQQASTMDNIVLRFSRRSAFAAVLLVAFAAATLVLPSTALASTTYRFVASYRLPAGSGGISDISCVAANDCVVVGGGLARTFDGHAAAPIAGLDGDSVNWFSVSCTKVGACMMVGVQGNTFVSALRATAASAWTQTTLASSTHIDYGFLGKVSCASASFCLAVMNYQQHAVENGVVYRWDGTQWHRSNLSPSNSDGFNYDGVSCPAAFQCVATGGRWVGTAHPRFSAFRAVLDGSTWQVANLPESSGTQQYEADQVSCWAVHHCIVDGFVGSEFAAWTWSGGAFVAIPGFALANFEFMTNLSCTSASFCVAAGENPPPGNRSLVLLWDGQSWTKIGIHVAALGSATDTKDLGPIGVSCSAAYSCWLAVERTDEQTAESAGVIDALAATT
jgi:hypothetical protein